jgi:hypothetical protein
MFRKLLASFALLLALPFAASAQVSEAGKPVKQIFDASIVGTVVWHSDTIYNIKEGVYVDSGEVLIIQPGTIIKSDSGTQANAKYLFVSKGGKIYAEGTPTCPIIFTSIFDNVDNPTDLPLAPSSKGLWGGLVLAGSAVINAPGGSANAEGIPPTARTSYGGTDDNDNSGVVRYVSLRHGGTILAPNNEINGITFYGVGRKTRADHIEVFMNADDGVEFFGGCVNVKYFASIFNDDDNFDTDVGYRGSIQYGCILQFPDWGDKFFEQDGALAAPWTDLPASRPIIANITAIGSGATGAAVGSADLMRENTGGAHYNSILMDRKSGGNSFDIETRPSGTHSSLNNYLPEGDANDPWVGQAAFEPLAVRNNIFHLQNGGPVSFAAAIATKMTAENDINVDPLLNGIDRSQSGNFDPTLQGGSPAITGGIPNPTDPDNWLDDVDYQGGFDPDGENWMCYWTFTSWGGIMTSCDPYEVWSCITETGKPIKQVFDTSIHGTVYFSNDTIWNIKEGVYVDSGEILIVGPGTVIKSDSGQQANAKYVNITRGGKGYWNGCPDCPVVMTSIFDNVEDELDLPLSPSSKGLWGGLVLNGYAVINLPGGTGNDEGIPPSARTIYGGTDDNDNSGSFRYVSLRHGGTVLAPNNEINGMTFYGVGRQTRVDHIEAYMGADDAFEWFGGTVNTKYMVSVFNDDDAWDTDQGYRGASQFGIDLKFPDWGDRFTEQDGANAAPWTDLPVARPLWANMTWVGSGAVGAAVGGAILERENTAGGHYNNLITDAKPATALDIQQFAAGTNSARNNFIVPDGGAGDPWPGQGPFNGEELRIRNNRYFKFNGSINTLANSPNFNDSIETKVRSQNGVDKSPFLGHIQRDQNQGFDPRPRQFGVGTNPVWTGGIANPTDPDNVLDDVNYQGALAGNTPFDSVWFYRWTFLASGKIYGTNYIASCCTLRGNVNNVGGITVADLTFLVQFLFNAGSAPSCTDQANVNAVGGITVADLTYLVQFLFNGGAAPSDCE